MKVIQSSHQLSDLPLQECAAGRWYHWNRITILKKDTEYMAISFDIFERMMAVLYSLFNQNYFSKKLNDDNVVVLSPDSFPPETRKTSAIAQDSALSSVTQVSKDDEADKIFSDFERKRKEKEAEDIQSMFIDLMAIEITFSGLEQPGFRDMNLAKLAQAASVLEEFIQKNAVGDSIEISNNDFTAHPLLNHFDTLVAASRRLVFSGKIRGYSVDTDKSLIKIALTDQSTIAHEDSFMDQEALLEKIVKPVVKSLREEDLISTEEAPSPTAS